MPEIFNNKEYIKPEEINFDKNYDKLDPFKQYENIPQPLYLAMDVEETQTCSTFEKKINGRVVSRRDQDEEDSLNISGQSSRNPM